MESPDSEIFLVAACVAPLSGVQAAQSPALIVPITTAAPEVKSYPLLNIPSVVSNNANCAPFSAAFQQPGQTPIVLQFRRGKHKSSVDAKDLSGQVNDLNYTALQQTEQETVFHRVGMGSFEF